MVGILENRTCIQETKQKPEKLIHDAGCGPYYYRNPDRRAGGHLIFEPGGPYLLFPVIFLLAASLNIMNAVFKILYERPRKEEKGPQVFWFSCLELYCWPLQ